MNEDSMKRNFYRVAGVVALSLSTLVVTPVSAATATLKWHAGTRIAPALGTNEDVACTIDKCLSVTANGMLQTTDHATWTRVTTALVATAGFQFINCDAQGTTCEAANGLGAVVTTTDDGATWTKGSSLTSLVGKNNLFGMTCVANAFCLAHFGGWQGKETFARATLSGGTIGAWSKITAPVIVSATDFSCPTNTNCIIAGSVSTSWTANSQILVSTNAGVTWTKSSAGSISQGSIGLTCSVNGGSLCLASGSCRLSSLSNYFGFLFRSTNYGASWSRVTFSSDVSDFSSAVCQSETNCLASKEVTTGSGMSASSSTSTVQSNDGGLTWSSAPAMPTNLYSSTTKCFAGHGCLLSPYSQPIRSYFSTDFASWAAFTYPFSSTYVLATTCVSTTICFTTSFPRGAGSAPGPVEVYKSTNGGTTWAYRGTLPEWVYYLSEIRCVDGSTCVAIGMKANRDTFVMRTTDAGANWSLVDLGSLDTSKVNFRGLSCVSSHCVIAGVEMKPSLDGTTGLLLDSIDGGLTWTKKDIQLDGGFRDVSCASATSCIAVGQENGTGYSLQSIVYGTSDGSNWSVRSRGTRGGYYSQVSCGSSASCVYLGIDGNYKMVLAYSTSGVTFTTKTYAHSSGEYVTCKDTLCVARYTDDNTDKSTYLMSTNSGKSFSTQSIADKTFATDPIYEVSCPSSTFCLGETAYGRFTKLSK